jgi:WD40 repeat protein
MPLTRRLHDAGTGTVGRTLSRWLPHAALAAALAVTTAAAVVLTAVSAEAVSDVVQFGELTLSPASGPVSSTPTWSTLEACPADYQGSAALYEVDTDGEVVGPISPVVTDVASPFSGTLLAGDTMASVLALSDVTDGESIQWGVGCSASADGTGGFVIVQSTDVTLSPDGSSYTTSCTGGNMCLFDASGATSLAPTWITTGGCPAAYLFSAALYTLNADGTLGTQISPTVTDVEGPFSGTLLADVADDIAGTGVSDGQTDKWVMVCFGPQGTAGVKDEADSMYLTLSADGSSYTSSAVQPALTATTTMLTASPQPVPTGSSIAMTATVTAADGTNPAGSVAFEINGTDIGLTEPAVNADGVATTTSDIAFSGPFSWTLEAQFTPANIFTYASSTSSITVLVSGTAGTAPFTLTIPATGALMVSIPAGETAQLTQSGATAVGTLPAVTVSDTRNTYPGWSVSAQEGSFAGTGLAIPYTIPGDELGWTPALTTPGPLPAGVVAGPSILPGTSPGGLGDTGGVLASAVPGSGYGTYALGATLTLDIPPEAPPGDYIGDLTLTFVDGSP